MGISSHHKIDLIAFGRREEARANAALKPGHVVKYDSSLEVGPGLGSELVVALHDSHQGKIVSDAYADNDLVLLLHPLPGDVFFGRLAAASAAITQGDSLTPAADGTLQKKLASGPLYAAAAASTALNTHTTITAFDVSYTIPAKTLRAGDVIRVRAAVLFANASNSTETAVITLKIGTVTIIATVALDHAAADVCIVDATCHFRAVGASGSVVAFGMTGAGPPASGTMKPFYAAAQAIDTTGTLAVSISQTCSASHANTGGQLVDLVVSNERQPSAEDQTLVALETVDNSAGVEETFVKVRAA